MLSSANDFANDVVVSGGVTAVTASGALGSAVAGTGNVKLESGTLAFESAGGSGAELVCPNLLVGECSAETAPRILNVGTAAKIDAINVDEAVHDVGFVKRGAGTLTLDLTSRPKTPFNLTTYRLPARSRAAG